MNSKPFDFLLSFAWGVVATSLFTLSAQSQSVIPEKYGKEVNTHLLNNTEWYKWKNLCGKIDGDINKIEVKIDNLRDAKNRREKSEVLKAQSDQIRSSIDEIFNQVNTELAAANLFVEDSKYFMPKLEKVRLSLDRMSLGKL